MRCASRGDHKGRPYSRPRWSDGLRLIIIAETELRIGWRRGHDSPAGGLRGAPLQNSVFACEKRGISFCQNGRSAARAFGRCVGNATRAATLDSMREVPTWPHAPPAPWPLDTTLASGGNAVGSSAAYFEPTATCTMKLALNSPRGVMTMLRAREAAPPALRRRHLELRRGRACEPGSNRLWHNMPCTAWLNVLKAP